MSEVWQAIVLAGIGTFLMRASFLLAAHKLAEVPEGVQRVLRQIPPAALAALVLPAFLRPEGDLDLWQPELAAGALAAAVCWRTRSTTLTLGVGMGVLFALRQVV
jgi:branched-subunit amino acid transport protein